MKKTKSFITIFLAVLMAASFTSIQAFADIPDYYVCLNAGEGDGEPIVLSSMEIGIADDYYSADYGQFYYGENEGEIGFRLPSLPETFTAPEGKLFNGWGEEHYYAGDYVILPESEIVFEATWIGSCFVDVTAEKGGSVTGRAQVTKGSEATVIATPYKTFDFDGWYENGIKVADTAKYTFTVERDVALVAKFREKQIVTDIDVKSVKAVYNSGSKKLEVWVKDQYSASIAGKKVTLKLNNKTYTATTDKYGWATFSFSTNIAPKTYTAVALCDGVSENVKVVIAKSKTKLTASNKTYKSKTNNKKYNVTLKNTSGKAVKGCIVKIKVNGKTYKAKTNSKGKATFKLKGLKKKGKYTSKIFFEGNNYYLKSSKNVKITVK